MLSNIKPDALAAVIAKAVLEALNSLEPPKLESKPAKSEALMASIKYMNIFALDVSNTSKWVLAKYEFHAPRSLTLSSVKRKAGQSEAPRWLRGATIGN
jgi:hypothetical protein